MRTLFVTIGVLVVLLLLFSSGSVSGEVCVQRVGCLRGDDGGFRLEGDRSPARAADGVTTAVRP